MRIQRLRVLSEFTRQNRPKSSQLDDAMLEYIRSGEISSQDFWELFDSEFPADLRLTQRFLERVHEIQPYMLNFYLLKLTQHAQPAVAALSETIIQFLDVSEPDAVKVLTNVAEAVPERLLEEFYAAYDEDLHLLCWSFSICAQQHPWVVAQYLEEYSTYIADFHRLNPELQLKPQNYFVEALATCIEVGAVPGGDYSELLFKNACDPESCPEDVAFCFESLVIQGFPPFEYLCSKNRSAVFTYCRRAFQQLSVREKLIFIEREAETLVSQALFDHGFKFAVWAALQVEESSGQSYVTQIIEAGAAAVGRAAVDDALRELNYEE